MSHARDFGLESGDSELAEALIFDYRSANLSPADQALCDYAVKLTVNPGEVDAHDVQVLRDQALTDEQITVAAHVIGYFNYINRIADGLGVELEHWMDTDETTWKERKANFRASQGSQPDQQP